MLCNQVKTALNRGANSFRSVGQRDRRWCSIQKHIFHSVLVRIIPHVQNSGVVNLIVSGLITNVGNNLGQYNCIGQHLAWRIMRFTIARVVKKYTFHLAPGFDGHNMVDDKVDRFTAFPGSVPLCFELREKEIWFWVWGMEVNYV